MKYLRICKRKTPLVASEHSKERNGKRRQVTKLRTQTPWMLKENEMAEKLGRRWKRSSLLEEKELGATLNTLYSPYCSILFQSAEKENLFNNQVLLQLVITLVTLM